MAGYGEKIDVNWDEINKKLPIGRDKESQEARAQLFKTFDPNGNGILSLAEVDLGLVDLPILHDCKQVVIRAFNAAKDLSPEKPQEKHNYNVNDYIDANEFRVFLVYLRYYLELFRIFDKVDTGNDAKMSYAEFEAALPTLEAQFDMENFPLIKQDPHAAFNLIDQSGGGTIMFDEFADFILRNTGGELQGGELTGDDVNSALDMLKHKQANLTDAAVCQPVHHTTVHHTAAPAVTYGAPVTYAAPRVTTYAAPHAYAAHPGVSYAAPAATYSHGGLAASHSFTGHTGVTYAAPTTYAAHSGTTYAAHPGTTYAGHTGATYAAPTTFVGHTGATYASPTTYAAHPGATYASHTGATYAAPTTYAGHTGATYAAPTTYTAHTGATYGAATTYASPTYGAGAIRYA